MRIILDIENDDVTVTSKKAVQLGKAGAVLETPTQPVSIEAKDAGAAPSPETLQTGPLAMIAKPASTHEVATPSGAGETINAGAAPSQKTTHRIETSAQPSKTEAISTLTGQITVVNAGPPAIAKLGTTAKK